MFGTHDAWLFAASLLIFNLTPGPDLLFTLTRTLQLGRRAGIAAAFGIGSGCLVHTAAAAFGLAALLAASAEAFTIVRWIGAGYLLWLAIGLLRQAPSVEGASGGAGPDGAWPHSARQRRSRRGASSGKAS